MFSITNASCASAAGRTAARDQRFDFTVRKAFQARFECSRVNPQAGCNPILDAHFRFTAPIAAEAAKTIRLTFADGTEKTPVFDDDDKKKTEVGGGKAPPRPSGVEAKRVTFAGNVEPPRSDWFLTGTGTGQAQQAFVPATARRPHIVNPLSGSVYAMDPDIPIDKQRLGVAVTGTVAGYRLKLDGHDLGDADARPQRLAGTGAHMLSLRDPSGRIIDRVRFIVR